MDIAGRSYHQKKKGNYWEGSHVTWKTVLLVVVKSFQELQFLLDLNDALGWYMEVSNSWGYL